MIVLNKDLDVLCCGVVLLKGTVLSSYVVTSKNRCIVTVNSDGHPHHKVKLSSLKVAIGEEKIS